MKDIENRSQAQRLTSQQGDTPKGVRHQVTEV